MRGEMDRQPEMFSYVDLESRIPSKHPIRKIRRIVDEALADPTTHDDIKADHDDVIAAGGYGVPTLFIDGHCLFGPVLLNPPSGADAVDLWNAVSVWARFPELYELQHPKTERDGQRITEVFRPYLEARDWVSIDRGRVISFPSTRSQEPS